MDYLSKEGFHKSEQFKLYRDHYTEFSIRQLTCLFYEIYPKPFEKLEIEEEVYYKIAPFEDAIFKILKDNIRKNNKTINRPSQNIEAHRDISDENGFEDYNYEINFQYFYNNRKNKFSYLQNKYDPITSKISREHCIELCKLFGFNPKAFLPKEEHDVGDEVSEKKERKLSTKQEDKLVAREFTENYYKTETNPKQMHELIEDETFLSKLKGYYENPRTLKDWIKDVVPKKYKRSKGRPKDSESFDLNNNDSLESVDQDALDKDILEEDDDDITDDFPAQQNPPN